MCIRDRYSDRPSPFVEHVEDVGLAKLNLHRAPAWSLGVVALEIAIDPTLCDLDRNAARRPSAHLLERWSHDADQVSVVLSTEIGFKLPAVPAEVRGLGRHSHRSSPDTTLARPASVSTIRPPSSSTLRTTPDFGAPSSSHSTRRPKVDDARCRHACTTSLVRPPRRSS